MDKNTIEVTAIDIVNAEQIIKLAIERNAFKPEEISKVGIVFDKLNAFSKSFHENAAKAAKAETGGSDSTEDANNGEA